MIFIVMGVSGCGKTTVGEQLAEQLGLAFYDADDFHSTANVDKMAEGIPLTDDDRRDWLAKLAGSLGKWEKTGGAVLACSALKEKYRTTLQNGAQEPLHWVFLDGTRELLFSRMTSRQGHYMKSIMLDSQLADLEKPPYALHLFIDVAPAELVSQTVKALEQDAAVGTNTSLISTP